MLRSDLCNYSVAYIIVKGTITVARPNNAKRNKAFYDTLIKKRFLDTK